MRVLLQLQAEAALLGAVTGLLLLGGFLSSSPTPILWFSLFTIAIANISEISLDPTATHKVFSCAFFAPITMLFIATSRATVWRHDNLV